MNNPYENPTNPEGVIELSKIDLHQLEESIHRHNREHGAIGSMSKIMSSDTDTESHDIDNVLSKTDQVVNFETILHAIGLELVDKISNLPPTNSNETRGIFVSDLKIYISQPDKFVGYLKALDLHTLTLQQRFGLSGMIPVAIESLEHKIDTVLTDEGEGWKIGSIIESFTPIITDYTRLSDSDIIRETADHYRHQKGIDEVYRVRNAQEEETSLLRGLGVLERYKSSFEGGYLKEFRELRLLGLDRDFDADGLDSTRGKYIQTKEGRVMDNRLIWHVEARSEKGFKIFKDNWNHVVELVNTISTNESEPAKRLVQQAVSTVRYAVKEALEQIGRWSLDDKLNAEYVPKIQDILEQVDARIATFQE